MCLDIMQKEHPLLRLLPQVVTLEKVLCVLPCSTAMPERYFSQYYQELYALNYKPAKIEPFDGDGSPP